MPLNKKEFRMFVKYQVDEHLDQIVENLYPDLNWKVCLIKQLEQYIQNNY